MPPSPSAEPPLAIAPPPQCDDGGCPEVARSLTKNDGTFVLHSTSPGAVLEFEVGGVPVDWEPIDYVEQPELRCSTSTEHLHCVVIAAVGAHGSEADLFLADGSVVTRVAPVTSGSPGIEALDLDGDGDLDLAVPADDYIPNYADGGQYWVTFELSHKAYVRTGCSAVVHGETTATPTTLLSGSCPD